MENSNSQRRRADEEMTVDLMELGRVIWNNIWVVIIGIVVGAVMAFIVTKVFITPKYQATSTIYILSKSTSITSLADLQIGSQLAGDFEIIATTRELLDKVSDELGLDMTYEDLIKEIKVTNPSNSHMLQIIVTDSSPEQAALISNTLADELREEIADIMNTDRPSTVERAVVPDKVYSPSTVRNTILGAIVLALLTMAVLVVRHISDDTIKDDEDIRKYLELDTLAQFPLMKGQTTKTKTKQKKIATKKSK